MWFNGGRINRSSGGNIIPSLLYFSAVDSEVTEVEEEVVFTLPKWQTARERGRNVNQKTFSPGRPQKSKCCHIVTGLKAKMWVAWMMFPFSLLLMTRLSVYGPLGWMGTTETGNDAQGLNRNHTNPNSISISNTKCLKTARVRGSEYHFGRSGDHRNCFKVPQ